jgi:hypothetical protein
MGTAKNSLSSSKSSSEIRAMTPSYNYADHPAGTTICRNRGWREGFLTKENWSVFCISFKKNLEV